MARRGFGRLLMGAMAIAWAAVVGCAVASAQGGRQPELMEGKKTLFKRVIVRPWAVIYPSAAEGNGKPMPAFSVLYVYGKTGDYVEVGKAIGAADGFIKFDKLIDWKQTIVAVFNNNRPARERSLMFKAPEDIDEVLRDPDPRARLAKLREDAAAGRQGDEKVVAIEPEKPADMKQNFYFFPILSVMSKRLGQRIDGRVLEVASLTKIERQQQKVDEPRTLADMRVGVVFVIDTTKSMAPYIEAVRQGVTILQNKLGQTEVGRNLRMGLIGFRQNLQDNTPAVEYHVKTFLRLGKEGTTEAFLREIVKVKDAPVETRGFDEDSLGGLYEALTNGDWRDFDQRFIVLVTDAGPLLPESGARLYKPNFGLAQMRDLLKENKTSLIVLHMLTPEGNADHASAEAAYRAIANEASSSFYYGVPKGALASFVGELEKIATGMLARVQAALAGDTSKPKPTGDPTRDAIERNFYAMQLAYLGRREGSRVPDMFRAHLPDRDLSDPTKEATEIRLILTRNQLATMYEVTKGIIDAAERSRMDSSQFFNQLKMAIATIARDPNRKVVTNPQTLGAALGEFLDGLPYAQASPILSIDSQMWLQMGAARQVEMRSDLQRKLQFMEEWNRTPDNWVEINRGAPEGEKITAYPLSQLP